MWSSSYDRWLEKQREKYEAPFGYCRCGEPATIEYRYRWKISRFCEDCYQEPPEDD